MIQVVRCGDSCLKWSCTQRSPASRRKRGRSRVSPVILAELYTCSLANPVKSVEDHGSRAFLVSGRKIGYCKGAAETAWRQREGSDWVFEVYPREMAACRQAKPQCLASFELRKCLTTLCRGRTTEVGADSHVFCAVPFKGEMENATGESREEAVDAGKLRDRPAPYCRAMLHSSRCNSYLSRR